MVTTLQPSAANSVHIDDLIALVEESDDQRVSQIMGMEKNVLLATLDNVVRKRGLQSDLRQKLAALFRAEQQAAKQMDQESEVNQAAVADVLEGQLAAADPEAFRIVQEARQHQERVLAGAQRMVEENLRGVESEEAAHIQKQLETQNWKQN